MRPQTPPARLFSDVADQAHDHLLGLLDQALSGDEAALATMRVELGSHFAEEEEPEGLFDWIEILDPSAREDIKALEQEHVQLTALLAAATAGPGTAELARMLRIHEAKERQLRQRVQQ